MKKILLVCLTLMAFVSFWSKANAAEKPNILWVTSEDNGPHLGCYGFEYADTPNLDALAKKGMMYRIAWSNAPVCAPARTTIISGIYPPATGGQHMRSMAPMPKDAKMYPEILKSLGYHCTNSTKEDYNLQKPSGLWDKKLDKTGFKTPDDKPFFSIFNYTISHESKLRTRPYTLKKDPAKVPVPAYHPDTPEVRLDWAQYHDRITEMDGQVGSKLKELKESGKEDNTIIFYYGDHGSGMPRSKRWPFNSGLHVPMIIYIPESLKHLRPTDYVEGGTSDRLVAFVDLGPTAISLAGQKPPAMMQGKAFAGKFEEKPKEYLFGFRGRMDERYDFVRSVTDGRYVYIRNFNPHKIYGQHVGYMFQTPTTQIWKKMFDEGKLNEAQSAFWKTKPVEELYDLKNDPDEVKNLAKDPDQKERIAKFRKVQKEFLLETRDLGFLPEGEMHWRSEGSTPYDMGHDPEKYPLEKIYAAADLATNFEKEGTDQLVQFLSDSDSAVRYWGVIGLLIRGEKAVSANHEALEKALGDDSPYVKINAAYALAQYGSEADLKKGLDLLMSLAKPAETGPFTSLAALNAIDDLQEKAAARIPELKDVSAKPNGGPARVAGYSGRMLQTLLGPSKGDSSKKKKKKEKQ